MLALATDADACALTTINPRWISPDGATIRLLGGSYRIPPRARSLLRAAVVAHQDHAPAPNRLFVALDESLIGREGQFGLTARTSGSSPLTWGRRDHLGRSPRRGRDRSAE